MAQDLGMIFGAILALTIFAPVFIFIFALLTKIDVDGDGKSDI